MVIPKLNTVNPKSRSQVRSKIKVTQSVYWLTSFPFHVNQSIIPEILLFQNLTLKIQGQDHGKDKNSRSNNSSNILSGVPCQSAWQFLKYSYFAIGPWKCKDKVRSEVSVQGHMVGPTFYRLTSLPFQVNQPYHSYNIAISKSDLESIKVKVMGEIKFQGHIVSPTSYQPTGHIHFAPGYSALQFLRYSYFVNWPWKSKVKVMN